MNTKTRKEVLLIKISRWFDKSLNSYAIQYNEHYYFLTTFLMYTDNLLQSFILFYCNCVKMELTHYLI